MTAHLVEWLAGEEHQRLRRVFAIWLNRRLRHRVPEADIPETDDLATIGAWFDQALDAVDLETAFRSH